METPSRAFYLQLADVDHRVGREKKVETQDTINLKAVIKLADLYLKICGAKPSDLDSVKRLQKDNLNAAHASNTSQTSA